jgi:hypothetical protein
MSYDNPYHVSVTNREIHHLFKLHLQSFTTYLALFFSRELFKLNPQAQQHYSAQWLMTMKASDSLKLADFAAAITTADASELQQMLEGKFLFQGEIEHPTFSISIQTDTEIL